MRLPDRRKGEGPLVDQTASFPHSGDNSLQTQRKSGRSPDSLLRQAPAFPIHAANLTCFRVRIACSFHPKWVNSRCRLPELQHESMGNGQPADIPIPRLNSKDLMSFTLYLYMVIPDFSQNRGI